MRNYDGLTIKDLVSVNDAASRADVSRRTIYDWIAKGKVWHCIVGNKIMLHKDDVAIWERTKI